MAGVEIAWNQIVNQPGQSRVEDNISVFQSSGTASSPMLIHDNYIDGAYAADPATDTDYTGGGIMVSDGNTNSASTDTGHVRAYNNVVIDTTNYGIAVSSGQDNQVYDNTVISTGKLSSGETPASQNVGIYVWNQSGDPYFTQPEVYGNVVGWMGKSGRNDEWTPDAGSVDDTAISGSITQATETQYYNVWAQRVNAAGFQIGA
jgi:parallel beta-helix repeat protein